MHHMNNAVIMQTEQLSQIEALEEELRSFKAKTETLEQKLEEQDWVITNLVGDNLEHLQDNMRLTAHINSSQDTGGEGAWKPTKTSWVHCRLWLKVPTTYPPITDWVHSKCSCRFQVKHMM